MRDYQLGFASFGAPLCSTARAAARMLIHRRPRCERPHLPRVVVLQGSLIRKRDLDDLDLADSDLGDELRVTPDDRPGGLGCGRPVMGLTLERDGGLIQHVPPHGWPF